MTNYAVQFRRLNKKYNIEIAKPEPDLDKLNRLVVLMHSLNIEAGRGDLEGIHNCFRVESNEPCNHNSENGYKCSLAKSHEGPHVACGTECFVSTWENKE